MKKLIEILLKCIPYLLNLLFLEIKIKEKLRKFNLIYKKNYLLLKRFYELYLNKKRKCIINN